MIEHIENRKSITSLFGDDFDITDIDMHELSMHRDGPTLKLRFEISMVPAVLPSRSPRSANTTQIVLSAGPIDALRVSGFATECNGVLRSRTEDGQNLLEFDGPGCSIRCGFSWLRVESVSCYVNESQSSLRDETESLQ